MLSPAAMTSSLHRACLAALAAALPAGEALACTVLNVTTDETVLVGRNQDWFDETRAGPLRVRYLLEFVPAAEGRRGAALGTAALADRHLVFEGMNDAGLYVGLAATPRVPVTRDPRKLAATSSELVRALLARAATVEEAVAAARVRSLQDPPSSPSTSHFMVVDPSGRSAVLEYVGDELRVVPKQGRHQHMTDDYLTPVELRARPFWATDGRHARAARLLAAGGGRDQEGVLSILRAVVMTEVSWATQYALVYDLRARTLALAPDRRWDEVTTFQLDRELAQGLHSIATRSPGAPVRTELSPAAIWGAEVVSSVDGELYRHAPGGGSRQVTALATDAQVTCGEDGRLAFSRLLTGAPLGLGLGGRRTALYTVRADGTELHQLTDGASADLWPVWSSRDAGVVLFSRLTPRQRWEIHRTRAGSRPGDEQRLSDGRQSERLLAALRDGRLLVESDRHGAVELFALTPRAPRAPPRYERLEARPPLAGRVAALALSPDEAQALVTVVPAGAGLAATGRLAYLARFDPRTLVLSDARPLGRAPDDVASARFGPDGRSLFYLSGRTGSSQLYRRDLDTGDETRVTLGDAAQDSYCLPGVVP